MKLGFSKEWLREAIENEPDGVCVEAGSGAMNVPHLGPIEIIKETMAERGLTRRDLRPMIGSRGRVSDVLNKRRPLSLPMIRALVKHLNIPARLLIDEYELRPAKARLEEGQ